MKPDDEITVIATDNTTLEGPVGLLDLYDVAAGKVRQALADHLAGKLDVDGDVIGVRLSSPGMPFTVSLEFTIEEI